MTKKALNVYQFKISLLEVKPLIWRRIQVVETYSFWDLHVAIQDAMGWQDYHLHEFNIINPNTTKNTLIGYPEEMFGFIEENRVVLASWLHNIQDFFSLDNPKARYNYDFGDDWEHEIVLEAILPKEPKVKFPKCLAGARSCPPEDCGGPGGYARFLQINKNSRHPDYQQNIDWLGKPFNANNFDATKVRFDSPTKRWNIAFKRGI